MRIIAGIHKGRRLSPPKNLPVRPTTDFAKEGFFNLLQNRFELEGSDILDLCAGTGNLSLEFASREANSVLSIDRHQGCLNYIYKMSKELNLTQIKCIKSDLFQFLNRCKTDFDLIFADPPYGLKGSEDLPNLIFELQLLRTNGFFILEHGRELNFENHPNYQFSRKYGNVNFTFFQKEVS